MGRAHLARARRRASGPVPGWCRRAGRAGPGSPWRISFDPDHETIPLRDGETRPGKLAQGEYGARVAVPKILRMLAEHGVPASFFMPAVSALLHPGRGRGLRRGRPRGRRARLDPRAQHAARPRGRARPHRPRARDAGEAQRRAAGRHPHAELGLLRPHPGHHRAARPALRLVADGRRRALRAARRRAADRHRGDPGRMDPRRRALPDDGALRRAAALHAAAEPARHLARRVRRRLRRGRAVPAHPAPAHHRAPVPPRRPARAARAHHEPLRRLARHPCADRRRGARTAPPNPRNPS